MSQAPVAILAGNADEIIARLQGEIDRATASPSFARHSIDNDIRVAIHAIAAAAMALDNELAEAGRKIAEASAFLKLAQQSINAECARRDAARTA